MKLKTHGLRRGTAQTPCGVWVSQLLDGTFIRVDAVPAQPTILVTRKSRKVNCLKCKTSSQKLTRRDDRC